MVVMESGVCLVSTISAKFNLIWFSGIDRKNLIIIKHYTKHMLNTGKIYSHKILGNTYVEHRGKFFYINYLGICYVEHCGKIDLINNLLSILYVEHCGKIYLHKILRHILC